MRQLLNHMIRGNTAARPPFFPYPECAGGSVLLRKSLMRGEDQGKVYRARAMEELEWLYVG